MGNSPDRSGWPSRKQLGWFLVARVLVITLFLGGAIVHHLRGGVNAHPAVPFLYLLIGISYLQAGILALLLPAVRRLRLFIQAQVTWDLIFATGLIYVTGGSGSIFSFIYLLVIVSASIFLSRKEVFFIASAAAILYGSLLDLQFYGYLPRLGGLIFPGQVEGRQIFYAVFVHVVAFSLTALLSGTVTERLRRSERALEEREINYEELEHLNRSILANITSGLMIINAEGRIRSFNAAAEKITGFTMADLYDRDIRQVFPNFRVIDGGGFTAVSRGEAKVTTRSGEVHILGYATSTMGDAKGPSLGLLITFQDLTPFKSMEEQLKRADRLAAVGRLASGMAHEIRNPLASISGSVQLLMEDATVSDEDKKLMRIVVKEANRLSNLLTDFLVFARPKPPKLARVDVSALLAELIGFFSSDPRFKSVEIRPEFQPAVIMNLDRLKFRQAIWNLAINGAEMMPEGGTLYLGIEGGTTIYVEDTGHGIAEEVRDRIFDPFFTTKDLGTGLGLATVYTIVEMHGGRIEVGPGRTGGAKFSIHLP